MRRRPPKAVREAIRQSDLDGYDQALRRARQRREAEEREHRRRRAERAAGLRPLR